MKFIAGYGFVFLSISFSLIWMKRIVVSPDKKIVGSWNERSWEYEKVYNQKDQLVLDTISQSVKDQLGKHLVIHSAETWRFNPNGILMLEGLDVVKIVKWKLKGRGHILQLEYDDKVIEHYNLTELTSHHMVLNFDSDMQIKGIAKLTFDK